ncbi:hypothetical protein BCR32DRAFT_85836 [Anaeromyces robustus]|uniref:ABC transmembrane type-1 domain-containing protein n=1 Tax=Anaeromyces robustus TaxID=1754192 RepID=A0A1Y1WR94_9FUNG|nr:hypothetical protein BCR32DRAFT_85836 [Anaeromyces robustus]|eukprot:ORX75992.1 hypothetical protein BCR32DRAFT_85836 [Anaeromyces robustus]
MTESTTDFSDITDTRLEVENSLPNLKEKESKLSFSQFFKYCISDDKILIFFGIFFSAILGVCLSTIPLRIGDFIDLLIFLVRNKDIKSITNIDDDNVLGELMEAYFSQDPLKLKVFNGTHPSINLNIVSSKLRSSYIGNASPGSITFKTIDNIWDDFYKIILKLGIIFLISLLLTYCAKVFLDLTAFNIGSTVRSLVSICLFNNDKDNETKDNKLLKQKLDKEIKIYENGIGFNVGKIFRNIFILITCYVFAFIYSWKSALITLAVVAILFIFIVILRYIIHAFVKKFKKAINSAGSKGLNIINTYETINTEISNPEIDDFSKTLRSTKTYGIITGIFNGIFYGGLFGLFLIGIGFIFKKINDFINKGEMERGDLFKVVISILFGTVMFMKIKGLIKTLNLSRRVGAKLYKIIDNKTDSTEDLIEDQDSYDQDQDQENTTVDNFNNNDNNESSKEEKEKDKNNNNNNINIGRFISLNKRYIWAILIGIIASIVNGGILPFISLIISSVFGASNDGNKIIKYFSIFGGISLLAYLLLYIGYSVAGENLSFKLRKLLFNSFVNRKNDSNDLENGNGNRNRNISNSYISLFKKAGLPKGIIRNFGFIIEALAALIVGFIIDFLTEWKVTLILLVIVIIIIIAIMIIKYRKSESNDNEIEIEEIEIEEKDFKKKKIFTNSLYYAIIHSIIFLILGLIIYLCFTAVKTEFLEYKDVIKMLMATVLSFASIVRAKMNLPDMNKAKKAYKSVMEVIDK